MKVIYWRDAKGVLCGELRIDWLPLALMRFVKLGQRLSFPPPHLHADLGLPPPIGDGLSYSRQVALGQFMAR